MKKIEVGKRYCTSDTRVVTLVEEHLSELDDEGNPKAGPGDVLVFDIEDGDQGWPMHREKAEAWIKSTVR